MHYRKQLTLEMNHEKNVIQHYMDIVFPGFNT